MNDLPSKDKAPIDVNVIGRWLGEASAQTGVAAGRLRRWLGFMVVAAMLDSARHAEDGEPLFLVKGGVAMELRIETGRERRRTSTPPSGRVSKRLPTISIPSSGRATASSPPSARCSSRSRTPAPSGAASGSRIAAGR